MLKCIQSETDNIWLTQQQLHKQSQGNVMYALDKLYLKEWYLYKTGVFLSLLLNYTEGYLWKHAVAVLVFYLLGLLETLKSQDNL